MRQLVLRTTGLPRQGAQARIGISESGLASQSEVPCARGQTCPAHRARADGDDFTIADIADCVGGGAGWRGSNLFQIMAPSIGLLVLEKPPGASRGGLERGRENEGGQGGKVGAGRRGLDPLHIMAPWTVGPEEAPSMGGQQRVGESSRGQERGSENERGQRGERKD